MTGRSPHKAPLAPQGLDGSVEEGAVFRRPKDSANTIALTFYATGASFRDVYAHAFAGVRSHVEALDAALRHLPRPVSPKEWFDIHAAIAWQMDSPRFPFAACASILDSHGISKLVVAALVEGVRSAKPGPNGWDRASALSNYRMGIAEKMGANPQAAKGLGFFFKEGQPFRFKDLRLVFDQLPIVDLKPLAASGSKPIVHAVLDALMGRPWEEAEPVVDMVAPDMLEGNASYYKLLTVTSHPSTWARLSMIAEKSLATVGEEKLRQSAGRLHPQWGGWRVAVQRKVAREQLAWEALPEAVRGLLDALGGIA